jgi:hypothetical protein
MRIDGGRVAGWVTTAVALVVLTISVYSVTPDRSRRRASTESQRPTSEYVPDEVTNLLRFVDSTRARAGAVGGHEYAAAGVRYVAAALGSVASSAGLDVSPVLETVRERAARIERDPRPGERATQARLAFGTLAALFESVQQARFPGLEPDVANVSRAAASLRHRYPLVDQSDVVREFFNRAASAIRAMTQEMAAPPPVTQTRAA